MRSTLSYGAGLALLTFSFSSTALAQDGAAGGTQHQVRLGMTGGIFKRTGDLPNTATQLILLPDQELFVSVALTRRIRAEVPFTLQWMNDELNEPISTTVAGALADVFLRTSIEGQQSGFFAGAGATLHRRPLANDVAYQWGLLTRAGYEFPIGGMMMRTAATYERRFAAKSERSRSVYGVLAGIGIPISGDRVTIDRDRRGNVFGSVSPWYLNFGAALNYMTYGVNNSMTTIDIPSPYVGIFSMLGFQRRLAAGGRATFQYASVGSTSSEHIRLAPRLEYHFSRNNLRKKDVKLGAQMIFDGLSFADFTGSSGGTQTGFGGDVSFTLPHAPTIWNVGAGIDYFLSEEKTMRPATTSLRLEIGLDRYIVRR